MNALKKALLLNRSDNVATVLSFIDKGEAVEIIDTDRNTIMIINANGNIVRGHKIAVSDIPTSEDVIKYGQIIGAANVRISKGDYVHTHNFGSKRGRGDLR